MQIRGDQFWFRTFYNYQQGGRGAVGKLKRRNEKRVLQRDPVENLNEVILSLLHYIRIEQSCLTSDKSHELFDFWSKIGPKLDLTLSK